MIQTITAATHKTQNELSSFLGANFLNCVTVFFSNISQHCHCDISTCYRLGARVAPLGEELGEAVCAVGELLPRGEPLARQRLGAVGAGEALPVIGTATVGHTPAGDHLQITNRNIEKEICFHTP